MSSCEGTHRPGHPQAPPLLPPHPAHPSPELCTQPGPFKEAVGREEGGCAPPPTLPRGQPGCWGTPPASSPNPRAAVPAPCAPRCCSHSSQLASDWWQFWLYLSVLFKLQSPPPPYPDSCKLFAHSLPLACGGTGCSTHRCWQGAAQGAHPAAPHPCPHGGGLAQHCRGGGGLLDAPRLPGILCSPLVPRVGGAGPGPPTLTPRPGFGLWSRRSCLWRAARGQSCVLEGFFFNRKAIITLSILSIRVITAVFFNQC